jgi:SAM-dependent methyltransferase
MSIVVLTGPAGSGKTKHLIEAVNSARESGSKVHTFLARRAVVASPEPNLWLHGKIASRDPSIETTLDHVASTDECREILDQLPQGSLVAFDEAYYFDAAVADHWARASSRGVDVIVATPSPEQLERLSAEGAVERRLTTTCQNCGLQEAVESLLLPRAKDAISLCAGCLETFVSDARVEIARRLLGHAPYPGKKSIYQPVEIEECAGWDVLRPDSPARAELLRKVTNEAEERTGSRLETYLDVGCNTGYFCTSMAALGMAAVGVDVVEDDIELARLLTAFVRRDRCRFVVADVYDYLRDTRQQPVDVISAFSVIQWLILQRSLEHGVQALSWLFEKAGQVCVLELGYPSEEQYRGKLPAEIDRDWVREQMTSSGRFSEVTCFPAGDDGLMRDVFVGFTDGTKGARRTSMAVAALDSLSPYDDPAEVMARVGTLIRPLLRSQAWREYFDQWEQEGFHITPVSFYEPIPDCRRLAEDLWTRESPLEGIDLNEQAQVALLSEVFPRFAPEADALPTRQQAEPGFFLGNGMFDGTDALIYYCMIRHHQPRRIVEVGAGYSTSIALKALELNGGGDVISVDPHPSDLLRALSPDLRALIERPVQEVDPDVFEALVADDILFVDSSHVSTIGSDVNHLVFEVLPNLTPGVLVHFHDIFLPFEYPKEWVLEKRRFWSEQYLVRAFLTFNEHFEVILSNAFLGAKHHELLRQTFPMSPWWGGGSFWIRRTLARTATETVGRRP